MLTAIALWRRFPKQIATDLRAHYHDARIEQWHRGEMSSYELVDLLAGLPDHSRYKGAIRGLPFGVDYEWSEAEYRAAALVRQMAPLNDDGDMPVTRPLYEAYFSPVERAQLEAQQEQEDTRRKTASDWVLASALGIRKAVS